MHYSLLVFEIVFYNHCNITDGTYKGMGGWEGAGDGGGGWVGGGGGWWGWVGKPKVSPPCQ